jgi:hypothetical protein
MCSIVESVPRQQGHIAMWLAMTAANASGMLPAEQLIKLASLGWCVIFI